MGGFLSAIFGGSDPKLNANIKKSGAAGDFAQGVGEGDVTAASKFYRDILSGDPTAEATAIAPETKAAQEAGAQAKKTTAEFGNRSGGSTATMAGIDDKTRAELISLLGGLKTGAASGAASLGTAEQGISTGERSLQDQESQQRMQNWMKSILGSGITGAVNYAESWLPVPHGG
jgi:hypothetical protein